LEEKDMRQNGKTILACLLCGLGLVLLIAVNLPYQLVRNDAPIRNIVTSPESHASIRFSERTKRLESVNSGDVSIGFILVENTGNKVITDVAIKAGCRCSDVTLSQTDMNPGGSIRIDFSIDTRGKYEDFVEHFLFTYSEDEQSLFDVFYVTVPILAPGKLVAEPSSLLFNRARAGEQFSRVVGLRVKDLPEGESVDIVDLVFPDWMSANLGEKDAFWELTITGVLPDKSGRYVEFVQIKSSSQRYSEMIIPIIVEYATVPDSPE
jgi:hypothetical protein